MNASACRPAQAAPALPVDLVLEASMKVLVLSQYYPPDVTAAAFRIGETVTLLRHRGHSVRVVTARPHRAQAAAAGEAAPDPELFRTPIAALGRGGTLRYLLHYGSFMVNALATAVLRGRGAEVVWATSPPLFVALAGWAAARLRRVPLVLDVRDLWPDSAVVTGLLSRTGRLYRWAKRVERWLYRHADAVTCVARPMAGYIAQLAPRARIAVVYNGVPAEALERRPATPVAGDPIRVAYLGNFGYCQDLTLLLRAARTLRDDGVRHLRFLLVGAGSEEEKLSRFVREEGLEEVSLRGPVSKEAAFEIAGGASALFVQLKDDGTMDKTIPSKVFDYMVLGKPVVYGIEGEGRQLLERSGGNLYFVPGSLPDLVLALKRLAAELPALSARARANRQIVAEGFTRELLVDRLVEVFRHAVSAHAGTR